MSKSRDMNPFDCLISRYRLSDQTPTAAEVLQVPHSVYFDTMS